MALSLGAEPEHRPVLNVTRRIAATQSSPRDLPMPLPLPPPSAAPESPGIGENSLFRDIFRLFPTAASITAMDSGCCLEMNEAFFRITGYCREDVIGKSTLALGLWVHPEERAHIFMELQTQESLPASKIMIRTKAGETLAIYLSAQAIQFQGKACVLLAAQDLSEQEAIQEALLKTEARWHQLVDQAMDGILMGDSEANLIAANPMALTMTGYTQTELMGRPVWSLFSPETHERSPFQLAPLKEGQCLITERDIIRKDGSILPVEMNSRLMSDGTYQAILRDISDRRRSEAELRTREAQLRTLINAMPDIVCFKDGQGCWLEANSFALKLFELQNKPYQGKTDAQLAMEQDFYREAFLASKQSDEAAWQAKTTLRQEETIPQPAGTSLVFDIIKVPLFHPDGSRQGLVVIGRDITHRKQAELELQKSEQRFQCLFENTTDGFFWLRMQEDGGLLVEDINPAYERLSGLSNASAQGKQVRDLVPPELAMTFAANQQRCVAKGLPIQYEETLFLGKSKVTLLTQLIPIRDEQGHTYRIVGCTRDITQSKKEEASIRQTQRLESLGVLAGGIAHDFNNLLTAILGNLNLALIKSAQASPARPYLETTEKIVLKAAELTKQMLAYSGKGRFVVMSHDMNKVVQEITHLLHVSISKKIALHYQLEPDLPPFEADAAQIQQVVMNLVTNASDAIGDEEGVIRIATRATELDPETILAGFPAQDLAPGPFVVLEVEDTGCGMSSETLSRIFDPFFTTKRKGRGLGLSAMLGILKGHHAGIQIASAEGQGSCFTLFFPATPSLAEPPRLSEALSESSARTGHILLVDDEAVVRESTASILESLGFTVTLAVDGRDALEQCEAAQAPFDLILMDLTMPRMGGLEAFEHIRQHSYAPVILYSGYSHECSRQDIFRKGLAAFLPKPFTIQELKQAIRTALANQRLRSK